GPLPVPALEIEKFHPARHAANVRIGVIRGNFHAHFQLSAAGQTRRWIEQLLRGAALENVAAGSMGHDSLLETISHFCLPQRGGECNRGNGGGAPSMRFNGARAAAAGSWREGRTRVKLEPRPGSLVTRTVPFKSSVKVLTMCRPRPTPP